MSDYGSTTWSARHDGALTRAERTRELVRAARGLVRAELTRLARTLGLSGRHRDRVLEPLELPTTPLAAAALERLAHTPDWNVGHSLRTYAFGALLATRDGQTFDAELAFVAAALHDLGLVELGPARCFAHRGAELARATCLAAGAAPERAAQVAEAICLHLNVLPTGSAEARLVRAGAGYDVVGDRFFDLSGEQRRHVLARWPRGDFARSIARELVREADANPKTRAALLCAKLSFPTLIARADRWFSRDAPPGEPAGA